jgi:hypothetical protein
MLQVRLNLKLFNVQFNPIQVLTSMLIQIASHLLIQLHAQSALKKTQVQFVPLNVPVVHVQLILQVQMLTLRYSR